MNSVKKIKVKVPKVRNGHRNWVKKMIKIHSFSAENKQ
jgi:hypothetical protein